MSAVDRARLDLADGRLWKARDRLEGALSQRAEGPPGPDVVEPAGRGARADG
nr:hypothetical protein [Angustibacter aerolatus]